MAEPYPHTLKLLWGIPFFILSRVVRAKLGGGAIGQEREGMPEIRHKTLSGEWSADQGTGKGKLGDRGRNQMTGGRFVRWFTGKSHSIWQPESLWWPERASWHNDGQKGERSGSRG